MKVLALDLATSTGYAYDDVLGRLHCGTWLLATDKELKAASKKRLNRRCDIRIQKLFHLIKNLNRANHFDVIVFEDVQFSRYTLSCQLWSSLRAAAWLAPLYNPIFEAVPVATLKKFATGHGGATKEMMVSNLIQRDFRFFSVDNPTQARYGDQVIDDNAVDAVWLWRWGKQNLSRVVI